MQGDYFYIIESGRAECYVTVGANCQYATLHSHLTTVADNNTLHSVRPLCFALRHRPGAACLNPGPPVPERTLSKVLRGPIYCALTSAVLWSAMFRTGSAAPKLVKEYAAGDSFGELALLHGDPRAASGTARSVHAADGADECCAVQCFAVLCIAVLCCAVQCCAVQCSALQCSAVQCSALLCSAMLFDLQLKRQSRCACGKWTARRSGTPSASRVCGTRRPRAMVSADNADGIMRAVCVSGCQRIT